MDYGRHHFPGGTASLPSCVAPVAELYTLLQPPKLYLRSCFTRLCPHDELLQTMHGCRPEQPGRMPARSSTDLTPIVRLALNYLTVREAVDILHEFRGRRWRPDRQVLWSGMTMDIVNRWADGCGRQTLTSAMGPLKDRGHGACLRRSKTDAQWSRYIKGASALFTWCIAQGRDVTLVTPPPAERFHPSGMTSLQMIESGILAGFTGPVFLDQIEICHPQVDEACQFFYQLWPKDEFRCWDALYGDCARKSQKWRQVKGWSPGSVVVKALAVVTTAPEPKGAVSSACFASEDSSASGMAAKACPDAVQTTPEATDPVEAEVGVSQSAAQPAPNKGEPEPQVKAVKMSKQTVKELRGLEEKAEQKKMNKEEKMKGKEECKKKKREEKKIRKEEKKLRKKETKRQRKEEEKKQTSPAAIEKADADQANAIAPPPNFIVTRSMTARYRENEESALQQSPKTMHRTRTRGKALRKQAAANLAGSPAAKQVIPTTPMNPKAAAVTTTTKPVAAVAARLRPKREMKSVGTQTC
ncbi:transcription initiation factor TFIID subunit 3 [Microdochium nivale]|nr:transcription initiation factor TFIID subunit 3 [Microdochium nivale]